MNAIAINIDSQAVPVKEVESKSIFDRLAKFGKSLVSASTEMKLKIAEYAGAMATFVLPTSKLLGFAPLKGVPPEVAVGFMAATFAVMYVRNRLKDKLQKDKAIANPDKVIDGYIQSAADEITNLKNNKACYVEQVATARENKVKIEVAAEAKRVLSSPEEKQVTARLLQKSESGYTPGKIIRDAMMMAGTVGALGLWGTFACNGPVGNVIATVGLGYPLVYAGTQIANWVKRENAFAKVEKMVAEKRGGKQ